ncbi:MAG: inositol monophosphatase family protein [Acidimicrobiales bacterium]
MGDDELLDLLRGTADAIAARLGDVEDWGPAGTRAGQYWSDLAADQVAVERLLDAGVGVLSEESGGHARDRSIVVVVDPLDGSTNASRGVPWYATSLCAVDPDGPRAAVVVDLASRVRYEAVRGGGATLDGRPIRPTACETLDQAFVAVSGHPPRHFGWSQFRALGAAALDLCAVAAGTLDAFIDCSPSAHASWDYLGALLVCREAGAPMADADGRDLVVLDGVTRRTPVAAATPALLDAALAARATFPVH